MARPKIIGIPILEIVSSAYPVMKKKLANIIRVLSGKKNTAIRMRILSWRRKYSNHLWLKRLLYPDTWNLESRSTDSGRNQGMGVMYLTYIPSEMAGLGHQVTKWMTAYQLAMKFGFKFVHRPISGGWDSFLGLGVDEKTMKDLPKGVKKFLIPGFSGELCLSENHPLYIARNVLGRQCGSLIVLELDQGLYSHGESEKVFQDKVLKRHPNWIYRNKKIGQPLSIGLHIRRGDSTTFVEKREELDFTRFLPEKYYVEVIKCVRSLNLECELEIHVYSDGVAEEFPDLMGIDGLVWHLGESAHETFAGLCNADILIMGRSGFSYMAGLVNPRLKVATVPWWHKLPDDKDWVYIDLNRIQQSEFSNYLNGILRVKIMEFVKSYFCRED